MTRTIRIHRHTMSWITTMEKAVLQDTSLTWGARGLYAYLASQPEDELVTLEELEALEADCELGFTWTYIEELRSRGYVQ